MKINQLFILRFIAAVLVVFYHYNKTAFTFEPFLLGRLVKYGNESVNFFFFLSGFIMVVAHNKFIDDDTALNRKKYWLSRFERIYPVYILALSIVAIYYIFIDKMDVSFFSIRFILECTLFQGWIGKTSLNYPGWSLSVEFFFYLTFPFLFKSFKKMNLLLLLFLAFSFYLITQLLFYILVNEYDLPMGKKIILICFPLFHMSTFISGIYLGLIYFKNIKWIIKNKLIIKLLSYLIGFAIIFLIYKLKIFTNYHFVGLMTPVYFCLLIGFSLETIFTKILSNKLFIFLGEISYSIYILQFPIWLFCNYLFSKMELVGSEKFYLYLLILVLFSSLVNVFYEKPSKKWITIMLVEKAKINKNVIK